MALATLTQLKTAIGAGVRPNLFRVTSAGGFSAPNGSQFSILCKSAALPGSTIGIIEIPVAGGRRFKLAGDRTFAEWTTTVINDGKYDIRRTLENYQKLFTATDYSTSAVGNKATQLSTLTVEQLGQDGTSTIKKYDLFNCFISDISTIDLSYDSQDAIEEFTVTWVYDFFSTTGTL
jgi:hypothetical protein